MQNIWTYSYWNLIFVTSLMHYRSARSKTAHSYHSYRSVHSSLYTYVYLISNIIFYFTNIYRSLLLDHFNSYRRYSNNQPCSGCKLFTVIHTHHHLRLSCPDWLTKIKRRKSIHFLNIHSLIIYTLSLKVLFVCAHKKHLKLSLVLYVLHKIQQWHYTTTVMFCIIKAITTSIDQL